ncbi:MAG TPA: phosphoribosylglycinamide formyltransferase [Hyphomonadaceae bacterium]|nr:phosphoribosylglycinamide formyltransferase [Hyphomonadaceae bacterium]
MKRLGVLISGRGSNMAALLDADRAGKLAAQPTLILSNRPEAPGLAHARAAGIEAIVIDHKAFATRQAFEIAIDQEMQARAIDLIACAGFLRVLTPWFIARWRGRLINIHPSLLPLFPGLDTHQRALAAGARLHGCSTHFVTEGVDAGPLIAQAALAVRPDDNPDTLAARVLALEHRLFPASVNLVATGMARLAGEQCLLDAPSAAGALFSVDV